VNTAYTKLFLLLADRERGATAVEYGLMVALIAVAIIGAVTAFGDDLTGMFKGVSSEVSGNTPS
jgi:pilus assembly protein Flp/PilA